ncbi:hypothetical protein CJ184_001635 [Actinotignum urinale]|uniref:DUF8094 domain-containing protein n=1 Tax=Actinotignum urinale TaxID=190146 RepID=A0ABU5G6A3_9ACTO|nr:hypothetical protein [Actinotignum urinale]MDY5129452.1 hypothetical protein [Actinotignum urinale]MDY5132877.1 hypothetical protein [Actinotignum urinale]WIK59377.1 hypothetical protein CJ184_001635 [Actinotignum urinale]
MRKHTRIYGAIAAVSILFAGCGATSSLSAKEAKVEDRPAIATTKFKETVIPTIFKKLQQGDKELKKEGFDGRVSGPIARERDAHYRLKHLLGNAYKMPEISQATDSLAISGQKFPRNAIAIVNWASNKTTQGIDIFVQNQARDNWSVWAAMDILPGAKLPKIPAGEKGAQSIVAEDKAGLIASPKEIRDGYINALNGADTGGKVYTAGNSPTEPDTVRKELATTFEGYKAGVQGVGTAAQSFAPVDNGIQALRTEDGGALVIFQVNHGIKLSVTANGGKMTVKDPRIAALATNATNAEVGVNKNMDINGTFTIALYVPADKAKEKNISAVSASAYVITDVKNG